MVTRVETFEVLPDPGQAATLDDVVERLRLLKIWAGGPSYEWIKERVNAAWIAAGRPANELAGKTTVVDCFRTGRRRLNADLVVAVVQALHPDVGYVAQWRQALQVVGGQGRAAAQVRVQDALPADLAGFTGRAGELNTLRRALRDSQHHDGTVVISAIAGMAGVGKTQLAIRAGHLLAQDTPFDRVLFVNLRGFHSEPGQPPADPAAVLDGFLRLLGVPGHQIPHDLTARTTAYRERLAGTRTLVVLDNAADAEQVRPLLPEVPGCPVLVTSRRHLVDLRSATHLVVDVFTPDEALAFLDRAASGIPVGTDRQASARIARRCGYLPLALALVGGLLRSRPGWTLTDHAERLDEHHRDRRLDSAVEVAFDLSYRQLPVDQQRLLRLVALHPGEDFDAYAAAALADTDVSAARTGLEQLCRDHLLQRGDRDLYGLHDLVRAFAAARASDEDPPAVRRAALTRLFDNYLATAAAAMDTLFPTEARRRPDVPAAGTPIPTLTAPAAALAWLDTRRPTLIAVIAYSVNEGWPGHTIQLSAVLARHLTCGYFTEALAVHGHARRAAHDTGDLTEEVRALVNLGLTRLQMGRYRQAAAHLWQALRLWQQGREPSDRAGTSIDLDSTEPRLPPARPVDDYEHMVEARALNTLGVVEMRLGRYRQSTDHHRQALALYRRAGDRTGEGSVLINLGDGEVVSGRFDRAADHFQRALDLFRQTGDRSGEAWARGGLGRIHTRLGRPARAVEHYQRALAVLRAAGEQDGEVSVLNGLGEAARAAGHPKDALTHHIAALTIATDTGDRHEQARAHTGLGHTHDTLADPARARHHYQQALTIYADLGVPQAGQVRAHLTCLDRSCADTRASA